jgi:hypothetical protein
MMGRGRRGGGGVALAHCGLAHVAECVQLHLVVELLDVQRELQGFRDGFVCVFAFVLFTPGSC